MDFITDFEHLCVTSKEKFFNILKPHINTCPSVVINSLEDYENANLDEKNNFFCAFSGPLLASVFLNVQNESSKLKQKTLDFWVVKKKNNCTDKLEKVNVEKELSNIKCSKGRSQRKNDNSETNLNKVPSAKRCVRACRIKKSSLSSTSQNQVEIFKDSPDQAKANLIDDVDVHSNQPKDHPSSSKITKEVPMAKEVSGNTNEKTHKSPVSSKPKRCRSKKIDIANDKFEEGMLMDADKMMSSTITNTDISFDKDNKTDKVDKPTSFRKTRKGAKNEKQNEDKIPLKSPDSDDLFVATSSIDVSSIDEVAVAGISETSSVPVSSKNKTGFHTDKMGKKIVKRYKKLILPMSLSSDNTTENVKIKQSNTFAASKHYQRKGKKNIVDLCNPESIIPHCEEHDKELIQTKCLNEMETIKLTPQIVRKEKTLSPAVNSKTRECDDVQRTLRSKKSQRGRKRIVSSESDSQKIATPPKCQETNLNAEANILTHVSSKIQNKLCKNETQHSLVSVTKSRKGRRRTVSDEQKVTSPLSNFQEVLKNDPVNTSKTDPVNTSKTVLVKRSNKTIENNMCSPVPAKNSKRGRKKNSPFESIKETSSEPQEEKSIASIINDYSKANVSDKKKPKILCVDQSECQEKVDGFDLSEKNLENTLGPSKTLRKSGGKRKTSFEKMGGRKKRSISQTSEDNLDDLEKSPHLDHYLEVNIDDEEKSKLLSVTKSLHQVEIHDIDIIENNNKCTLRSSENLRKKGRRKASFESTEIQPKNYIPQISEENLDDVEKSPLLNDYPDVNISDGEKSKLSCKTKSQHQKETHSIDTSEKNNKYTLGSSTKVRKRGRKSTSFEKIKNGHQSSVLRTLEENFDGVEKSPESIENESQEKNNRNETNESDRFVSNKAESTISVLEVKEKETEITHDLKTSLHSKELNDICEQTNTLSLPSSMQGKYAAYCKLQDQLTAIGLNIEDLFRHKEVQDMMSNYHVFKTDGIIYIGTHKLPSTGEIVPVVHTHRSKSELFETIQKLSSKEGEKIVMKH